MITNLLTGIFQLSLNKYDDTMVFSGYSNRGWNVFRLNNPLDLDQVELKPTNYFATKDAEKSEDLVDLRQDKWRGAENFNETDYSRHIFALEYESYNKQSNQEQKQENYRTEPLKNESGDYIPQAYKTQFSLDVAEGQ